MISVSVAGCAWYCVGYETVVDSLPAGQSLMDEYRS